ncbi:hypothetical protein M434DRAFT_33821 [Hypoxylon sp. CO27-5]|nr:hypothetical protein M434DRAFT_33821 [Hypoxylon sp. CO27-5]
MEKSTILVLALAFTRVNAAPFKTISPHDIRRVAGTRRRLESPYESTARGASPPPTTIEVQRCSYVDSGSVKSRSKLLVSMTDLTIYFVDGIPGKQVFSTGWNIYRGLNMIVMNMHPRQTFRLLLSAGNYVMRCIMHSQCLGDEEAPGGVTFAAGQMFLPDSGKQKGG